MLNMILLLFYAILTVCTFKVRGDIDCVQYADVVLVNENTPVGTVVFTPSCTDTTGGTLSYSILNGRPKKTYKKKFKIDASGNIKIKASLNADFLHKFMIDIAVTSSSEASDIIKVAFKVINYNDNTPSLRDLPDVVKLPEDTPIGLKISTCRVRDRDKSDVHRLSIINQKSPEGNMWFLDKNNCDLYLNGELDYETKTSYTITIQAVDTGFPPLTSNPQSMIINVTDANDNYPVCHQYYKVVNISLHHDIGAKIGGMVCSDKDSGANGVVRYSLSASNNVNILDKFQVDAKTGDISLKSQLDYDTLKSCDVKIDVADSGTKIRLTSTVVYCIVVSGAEVVSTSSIIPITSSTEQHITSSTTVSQLTTISKPSTTVIKSSTTISKPPNTVNDPSTTLSEPSTTVSEPTTTVSELSTTLSEPSTTLSEPSTTTFNELSTTISEPSTTVSEPSTTISEPSNTVSEPSTTVSEKPNVSEPSTTVTNVTEQLNGGEQSDGEFGKGVGVGIGVTLAFSIVFILIVAIIYKYRKRNPIQKNPVLYAAKAMRIVSGISYEEFKC